MWLIIIYCIFQTMPGLCYRVKADPTGDTEPLSIEDSRESIEEPSLSEELPYQLMKSQVVKHVKNDKHYFMKVQRSH